MKYDQSGASPFPAAILVGAIAILAGCEDILDTTPKGEVDEETFYKTEQDFHGAMLGTYSTLLNYAWEQEGTGLFQGTYMPSDELRCEGPGGRGCNDDQFLWNAGNGNSAQLWQESYKGITRANLLLQNLPDAEQVSDEVKVRFEAEAKFLRGYFYFFLARHFAVPDGASIPLFTEIAENLDEAYAGPAETSEIWDLIESDLEFASQNMPDWRATDQEGRANQYSAAALLGKVRIYRAQWLNEPAKYGEAIQALEQVRQNGGYSLMPDYGDNFLEAHQNNAESLFEVQQSEGTDINGWGPVDSGTGSASYSRDIGWGPACYQGACAPRANDRSYGILHVMPGLQNLFERVTVAGVEYEDPRKFYTLASDGEQFYADDDTPFSSAWSITGSTPAKYVRPMDLNPVGRFHVNDYNNDRLIRYADVLLLLAEAYLLGPGDVGQAAALVNEVRARARQTFELLNGRSVPPGLLEDVPAAGGPEQFHRQYLQRERQYELSIEGHRYDDMVRWHRAGLLNIATEVDFGYDAPNNNWSEIHLLKPIPQVELERNTNLSQNPGY